MRAKSSTYESIDVVAHRATQLLADLEDRIPITNTIHLFTITNLHFFVFKSPLACFICIIPKFVRYSVGYDFGIVSTQKSKDNGGRHQQMP